MTDTLKYSLGALTFIVVVFLFNQKKQSSHQISGQEIFSGQRDDVYRIVISEADQLVELVRNDSIWSLSNFDSMIVKENQVDKIFDKLLIVKEEMLITSKEEKWDKFGVDDSLGRHLKIYNSDDKELFHYIFGNSGQDYQHNFIRRHKSSNVHRTNDNVYFLLNSSVNYWASKPKKLEIQNK
tara:strand:- start:14226 stop:14771 length:546 start_codon:yes stop_codon:yes gene_type:complete